VLTTLSPEELLSMLLEIETRQGRIRRRDERYGPRIIDLDLLFYGNLVINTPSMRVPHPRLAIRAFVLEPLNSIAPDWIHPMAGLTVAELLRKLKNDDPWIYPQEESPICKPSTT
jgi:2-amino-4-hydroxy-6-hydroxymethyldihydropteridine diphosphokinase